MPGKGQFNGKGDFLIPYSSEFTYGVIRLETHTNEHLFDRYVDPMYAKIELLPTDKALILSKQQEAQRRLAPHLRILKFFESRFNAIRLGNAQNQRLFRRLVDRTITGLAQSSGHPLARELHFRIVLFALDVLGHSSSVDTPCLWKLKDQILSGALCWFRHAPRYDPPPLQVENVF